MSFTRRAFFSYLAAVLVPLIIASQWTSLYPEFRHIPAYVYLLVIALAARFLGFGPALAATLTSISVLPLLLHDVLEAPLALYLRLTLFLAASIVIASVSRRRSEEAREADERYRTLVEMAPDGIVETDETGTITFANSALATILGAHDPEQLVGRSAMDFLPREDHAEAKERIDQLISGKATDWKLTRALRLDGSEVFVERAGVPILKGRRIVAQGFVRDLTEQRRTDARLRALFETALDSIVFLDTEGRFVDANPAACELYGMSREQMLKMTVQHPERWHRIMSGKNATGEFVVRRGDGCERIVEYRTVMNVMPGLHVSFLHDITARKEAERSLAQLSGRLLRSQDEERRRLARQLHDTTAQNLAALRVDLSRIRRWAMTAEPAVKDAVEDSIALADQSITEIRTLSYLLHPPLIDEVGLLPSLRWLTHGFEERSGIKVTFDAPESLDRLPRESETAVFRIVQEALNNIQRHSGSAFAHIRIARNGEKLQLDVEDEGRGMPENLREPDQAAAAGVGIAGMRERVRELGGSMRIESKSHGTRLAVTLPVGA